MFLTEMNYQNFLWSLFLTNEIEFESAIFQLSLFSMVIRYQNFSLSLLLVVMNNIGFESAILQFSCFNSDKVSKLYLSLLLSMTNVYLNFNFGIVFTCHKRKFQVSLFKHSIKGIFEKALNKMK